MGQPRCDRSPQSSSLSVMPRSRSVNGELLRQLNTAAVPVYVLDEKRRILFCNEACAAWAGVSSTELQGQTCHYHTPYLDGSAAAAAARLCPPPEAFAGTPFAGIISAAGAEGKAKGRRASFVPIPLDASGAFVVLAIAGADDLPSGQVNSTGTTDPAELESEQLRSRIRSLRQRLQNHYAIETLLGDSPAMDRVRQQVELASGGRASVLIVGPQGSGRQHIAKAIHYASQSEPSTPLVPLSCSLLGGELLHSTIAAMARKFGSEITQQAGPRAGTLLLTDVDLLPHEVQPELLRIMTSRTPLRVISTSTVPLVKGAVADFSPELALALSTLVIEVPSLRERPEDIPVLAHALLEQQNASGGRQVRGFSTDALDQLAAYAWPGNLTQLADVVRAAHSTAGGFEITPGELPERIRFASEPQRISRSRAEPIVLAEFLAKVEAELITRALKRAKGNKARAAKLLGMTRPRLYRRMVQLGLAEERS